MTLSSVTKPWIRFDDYIDHLSISVQLMNISPETELQRALFAEAQGMGLLLALGDNETRPEDRIRCAVSLAKLSAKVVYRRDVLRSVIAALPNVADEIRESIDKAIRLYWMVAKMANILNLIPQVRDTLAWAVKNSGPAPRRSEKNRVCLPWRSEKLADKMMDRYLTREVLILKIWESRFPNWMKTPAGMYVRDDGQKTPINPA